MARTYAVELTREQWHEVMACLLFLGSDGDAGAKAVFGVIADQLPREVREDVS